MLLLTSTTDTISLTSSAAATLEISAEYVDNDTNTGLVTPDWQATEMSTATTTTVVNAPGSGVQRNVQTLIIRNSHASITSTVSVNKIKAGGTSVQQMSVALGPGEVLQFLDGVGWQVLNSAGALKTSQNQGSNAANSSISTAVLAADVTNNNGVANTIADVTGLSFPVTAGNVYWFRFVIKYTAAATTTGSRWSINGPAITSCFYRSEYSLTTTSQTINEGLSAYDVPAASSASSAATGANVAVIEGIIQCSANGSVIARFASEIASSAIVAKAGSVVYYQQIA